MDSGGYSPHPRIFSRKVITRHDDMPVKSLGNFHAIAQHFSSLPDLDLPILQYCDLIDYYAFLYRRHQFTS
jgi:hypothetical protein